MKEPDKTAARRVRPLSVERLEERIVPSGGIFAWERSGLLFIEGDELGNDVTIDQEGLAPGEFRVSSGPDATEINGQAGPVIFEGVTRGIRLRLGGGDDVTVFAGCACPRVFADVGRGNDAFGAVSSDFSGNLFIRNRGGDGLVQLEDVTVGGNLIIRNGNGFSETSLQGLFEGNILINNGAGTSLLELVDSSVYGRVNAINRGGDSVSIFENVEVIRGINLRNGNGNDAALFDGVETLGRVSVINGNGDTVTGVVGESVFYGSFILRNANGSDELTVTASTIEGMVNASNGNGDTFSTFTDSVIGFDSFRGRASSLILRANNGADELTLDNTAVARHVNANFGNGGSFAALTETGVGGNLLLRSSNGADGVVMEYSAVLGSLIANTGNDGDGIWIDDSIIDRTTILNTGNGADVIALDTVTEPGYENPNLFEGRVVLVGGGGDDEFFLGVFGEPGAFSEFAGPIIVNGGPGFDYLDVLDNGNLFGSIARDVSIEQIV